MCVPLALHAFSCGRAGGVDAHTDTHKKGIPRKENEAHLHRNSVRAPPPLKHEWAFGASNNTRQCPRGAQSHGAAAPVG